MVNLAEPSAIEALTGNRCRELPTPVLGNCTLSQKVIKNTIARLPSPLRVAASAEKRKAFLSGGASYVAVAGLLVD